MPEQSHSFFPTWGIPIITALLGFFFAIVLERFKNRTVLLKFKTNIFQLAVATEDKFWGNIQVWYNNRQTTHLSIATIELVNDSNIDLEKVNVDFWVDDYSQILAQKANLLESGIAVALEEKYAKDSLAFFEEYGKHYNLKKEDANYQFPEYLDQQAKFFLANKKFNLPAFNRRDTVRFQILVENFKGAIPDVFVNVLHKSCKVVPAENADAAIKKRNKIAAIIWVFIYAIITYITFRYFPSPISIIWMGIFAFATLFFALGIYFLFRLISRIWR